MQFTIKTLAIIAATTCATSVPAIGQESDGTFKIDAFTCRDLLERGGDERDFVLVFMHGFMSGKLGQMVFDAPALTTATDAVIGQCIDEPDKPLLEVFEAARG